MLFRMNQAIDMSEVQIRQIQQALRDKDINPTAQRMVIATLLLSEFSHLSAEQVMQSVNQGSVKVSKATVYNTLNLFADKGLVNTVIVDPNKVFYDSNITEHYHFYNEDTGALLDLDPDQLEIHGLPELPENTIKSGIDVIVRVKNND
jgi:Fur family iron response transcriptional regulator